MMDMTTVTALITIIGCLLGLSGWYFGRKDAATKNAKDNGIFVNELGHIGNDVKDIKAEFRSFRTDINETRSMAMQAKALAETAHDRLDSLGAPNTYDIRRSSKE